LAQEGGQGANRHYRRHDSERGGSVLLGYLIYRSGFLPKVSGLLLALSGVGFVAKTFTWALAPSYSSPLLLMPAGVAALALTGWLLVKGVDAAKWEEKAALAEAR